jgi:NADPH:quinone reductase-like Zn-dependent oxidoreductase
METKAIWVQPGGGYDKVAVGKSDAPPPRSGEMTVRLRASSLNFHDYLVVAGAAQPFDVPRIPMADGAGEVIAIGDGVTEFAIGDAVVSTFFPGWLDGEPNVEGFSTTPGDGVDGYARETVTASVNSFTLAPKGWSHAEAATLPTAALTAWRTLVCEAHVKAGDTVLVQGTGGLSIFVLQIARMLGAQVIATSSSDAKLERLKELGADLLINYRRDPSWGETARRLTGGRGVDATIDVGGPSTLQQSLLAVRVGGHVSMIGVLGGITAELPMIPMLSKQICLQGALVGSRRQQQDLVRAIDANGMRPVLDRHFDVDAIVNAFRYQETNQHFGKIILNI